MNSKKAGRLRRAKSTRMKIREQGAFRLSVHRTPKHIYAQVTSPDGAKVLAQASTLDDSLASGATGNAKAAESVGTLVAERAKETGVVRLAHPSGLLDFAIGLEKQSDGKWHLEKAGVSRTARLIMEGQVFVTRSVYEGKR